MSAPQLKRGPLGGTHLTRMAITPFTIWGAKALWKSFFQYRARRRDPSLPQDRVTDRWWRIMIGASAMIVGDCVVIVAASAANVPRKVGLALFILLIPPLVLVLIGAFILGWRSVP